MLVGICLLWVTLATAGFALIIHYQNTGGEAGHTPQHWPSTAKIVPNKTGSTLIMFAHPQCPCTRASVEELNRLLARSAGRIAAQVWFSRPATVASNWTQTGLWRSVSEIPGAQVHEDVDDAQAQLFGAETSGYVVVYDAAGELRFKGGITGSRGHAGDNAGEEAIVELARGNVATLKQSPVYGCSLTEPTDDCGTNCLKP
jgi:hypothetical protein